MADIAKASGVSRQAVYLHFPTRAELLIAATRYFDQQLNVDERARPSQLAENGVERLRLFIEFWADYLPGIYPLAKALMLQLDTDDAAAAAWQDRMTALHGGCEEVITSLYKDGMLAQGWNRAKAADALWATISIQNWEQLTQQRGWTARQYARWIKLMCESTFVQPTDQT